MIYSKTIKEFAELVSSTDTPVPAGGTTIALNGLLGVELLKLTCQVSLKRIDGEKKNALQNSLNRLKKAEELFYKAMEDDILAFNDNLKNNFSNKKELKKIVTVPLSTALEAKELLDLTEDIEKYIKKVVKADFNIANYNLRTCIKGAISIIKSNYKFFSSEDKFIAEVKKQIEKLESYLSQY